LISGPRGNFVREFAGYVVHVDESNQTLKLHAADDLVSPRAKLAPTFHQSEGLSASEHSISFSYLYEKALQSRHVNLLLGNSLADATHVVDLVDGIHFPHLGWVDVC